MNNGTQNDHRRVKALLILLSIAGGSFSFLLALHGEATLPTLQPGSTIPDLSMTTTEGAGVQLHQILRGHSMLVLFTTDCPYCRTTLKALPQQGSHRIDTTHIVGLSLSSTPATSLWEQHRTSSFPVYMIPPSSARRKLGIHRVPTLILLQDTIVRKVFSWPEFNESDTGEKQTTHAASGPGGAL